jgi:hypothetical protein
MIMKFRTTLQLGGKTATGFEVPEEVVLSFGKGKRVPVTVTINDYTYRSTVGPYGGPYMVPMSAENREKAGLAAGDEFEADLEYDDAPREIEVPEDFATALAADTEAKAFFDSLSFSKQRWFVDGITSAKKPETRQTRVEKFVVQLREKKAP